MIPGLSAEAEQAYRDAEKQPMLALRPEVTLVDRAGVERLLPHRDPFLFIDRVTFLDRDAGLIVARYDLERAAGILAGHFPRRPMFPGVLHAEAIGQVGILLACLTADEPELLDSVSLTHVRCARFVRAVGGGGELELVARVFDDGLFVTVVGQTLHDGEVCAAIAASVLVG